MTALPVEGWAQRQVTYRHLIRPVVAFVRDHGPVPVESAVQVVLDHAPGDLSQASPTRDRADGAQRVVRLLTADVDAITRLDDGTLTVNEGVVAVNSAMFGPYPVPHADEIEQNLRDVRERQQLREWVHHRLFATVWNRGIRRHPPEAIAWMMEQITRFGYVGPKIVLDQEGAVIDGGLRVSALELLDLDVEDHAVRMHFANDRHRLAYVIAAHSTPGRTRIPVELRNEILRRVLPRGFEGLRDNGRPCEPTIDQWLAIVGDDHAEVASTPVDATPPAETPPAMSNKDLILSVMQEGEILTYQQVTDRLIERGVRPWQRIDRDMRDMAVGVGSRLYRFDTPNGVGYRLARPVPPPPPAVAPRPQPPQRTALRGKREQIVDFLRGLHTLDPERWTNVVDLRPMCGNPHAALTELERTGWVERRRGQVRYIPD